MRILLIFLIEGEEHPKMNLGLELYIFADFEGLYFFAHILARSPARIFGEGGSGLVAHLHLVAGVIWSKLWLGRGLGVGVACAHIYRRMQVHMRPHPHA